MRLLHKTTLSLPKNMRWRDNLLTPCFFLSPFPSLFFLFLVLPEFSWHHLPLSTQSCGRIGSYVHLDTHWLQRISWYALDVRAASTYRTPSSIRENAGHEIHAPGNLYRYIWTINNGRVTFRLLAIHFVKLWNNYFGKTKKKQEMYVHAKTKTQRWLIEDKLSAIRPGRAVRYSLGVRTRYGREKFREHLLRMKTISCAAASSISGTLLAIRC